MITPLSAYPEVVLLTGGTDWAYSYDLTRALAATGVCVEYIGSDLLDRAELRALPGVTFRNLRGSRSRDASTVSKVCRVLLYYLRLARFAATTRKKVFHILWNNKFETIDRTLLMFWYRALGKKIVLTAHNVNAAKRDGHDSTLNRLTLRVQYRNADHIFVHTEKMKRELIDEFGVNSAKVTVIAHPINQAVPNTAVTLTQARQRFGLDPHDRTILFFGRIASYKGLEYLVEAYQQLWAKHDGYRLLIVGGPKEGAESYWDDIRERIERSPSRSGVQQRIEFVPDEETEWYFKAADVLAMPYTDIFQSGILFLAYTFGLPVVATNVGSFRDDILEGVTGFVVPARDADEFARGLERFFKSPLFDRTGRARVAIRQTIEEQHSWKAVACVTRTVYASVTEAHR